MAETHNDAQPPDHARQQSREERHDVYVSRINVITLFQRLGYDLGNPDDISRLNENLRYAERQRQRFERLENNRAGYVVSGVLVFVGAALTAMVQWFSSIKTH